MRTAERTMELQLAAPELLLGSRKIAARNVLAKLVRSVANRFAVNRLTEMDDRQLADIGLVRADVVSALEISLLEDPALHLARAAKMRAQYRFMKPKMS